MDAIEAIKSRRSIRNYLEREISTEILTDLVECGRSAPTGYNRQPWTFLVITDQEVKEKIARVTAYGRFIREAGACIAVFCERGETSLEDACAATENIIIAARAYGLGTCWVNSHLKSHSEMVKEIVNCPDDQELMTMLAVGYYQTDPKAISKKSLEQVVKWDSF